MYLDVFLTFHHNPDGKNLPFSYTSSFNLCEVNTHLPPESFPGRDSQGGSDTNNYVFPNSKFNFLSKWFYMPLDQERPFERFLSTLLDLPCFVCHKVGMEVLIFMY